jgi:hypothetical protein
MNYAFVKDSSSSLESRAVPTPGSKIYLRSHMEWLHAETLRITHKTNSARAELWLKTYEMNAQKRQRDAMRWERWEASNARAKLFPKSVKSTLRRHTTSGGSSPTSSKSLQLCSHLAVLSVPHSLELLLLPRTSTSLFSWNHHFPLPCISLLIHISLSVLANTSC